MGFRTGVLSAVAIAALTAVATAWAGSVATGPDPAISKWADWPFQTTCWGPDEAFDPLVAFNGPAVAETGSSPAEQALREAMEEQKTWAQPLVSGSGWRLIGETETRAQFTRGMLSGTLEWVGFDRDPNGSWRFSNYSSDCDPTTVWGSGTVITWSLARKQRRLTPDSRTLWIDLGPGECAGGARQNPRAHFRFRTLGRKLLMVAWLEPVRSQGGGGFTCEGTIEPSKKVRLPFPLGDLRLYDGATFPPVPAGKTRNRYY